ncbi:MAG: hypothetical protein Q9219_000125 [cf. Caloplaca sp. 3 TL-2023]
MSRSKVVMELLAARAAARQSPQLFRYPEPAGNANFFYLVIRRQVTAYSPHPSSEGGSAIISHLDIRGQATACFMHPFGEDGSAFLIAKGPATAFSATIGADRCVTNVKGQARRDRLATAAAPALDKASITPGTNQETWMAIRQRHVTPRKVAGSYERHVRPALASRVRRTHESRSPRRQSPSGSSNTTGRSFSMIQMPSTPSRTAPLRPMIPEAPRQVKFREAGIHVVPFPDVAKSSKALPKGILKKAGDNRGKKAEKAVGWVGDDKLEAVKVVERWIGCVEGLDLDLDSPDVNKQQVAMVTAAAKAEVVHPDPTKYLGRLWGWTGPDGDDNYIFGSHKIENHAECQSLDCNKKTLHQYRRKAWSNALTGNPLEHLPMGEPIQIFNARLGWTWSSGPRRKVGYPKDRGLLNIED